MKYLHNVQHTQKKKTPNDQININSHLILKLNLLLYKHYSSTLHPLCM